MDFRANMASVTSAMESGMSLCGKTNAVIESWNDTPPLMYALHNELSDLVIVLDNVQAVSESTISGHSREHAELFADLERPLAEACRLLTTVEVLVAELLEARDARTRCRVLSKIGHTTSLKDRLRDTQLDLKEIHGITKERNQKSLMELDTHKIKVETKQEILKERHDRPSSRELALGLALPFVERGNHKHMTATDMEDQKNSVAKVLERIDGHRIGFDNSTVVQPAESSSPRKRQGNAVTKNVAPAPAVATSLHAGAKALGAISPVSFVMQSRRKATCSSACPCACHSRPAQHIWFRSGLLGMLFIGYSGQPAKGPQCNSINCLEQGRTSLEVKYVFPGWFVYYAISATFSKTVQGSPRFELVFKRRIDFFPGTIMLAVKTDDLEALKLCLKLDPDAINCVVPGSGWGPLHIAIELGFIKSTRFLLQQGSDLDQVDDYGRSAGGSFILNLLSGRYNAEQLRQFSELISTSKYLDDLELSHLSKVVVGICQGDIHKLVRTLTKEELDHKDAIFQMTAVHWAAVRQDDTTLRALLDAGAAPDLNNLTGVRPLSLCLKKGENPDAISCFEALASYGADLNHRDPVIGWQPIHWTCRTNCVQVAKRLVAAGTDVDSRALKPGVNDTPAAALAAWWGSFDVLKFLVDNGADIEADNGVGHTSLVAALLQNQHSCLRFLLERGANYLLPELPGENILHLVAQLGDAETMSIFSAVGMRGVDVDERNKSGLTPREIFMRKPATDKIQENAFEELLRSVETLRGSEDDLLEEDEDLFFDAEESK
ncbi:hypothetical protein J7T55_014852 [Diaporthe amygdali]|uniref:uncharacterized protein n=1 Tax=Phomopsis amygdali TaxID=1214568 RepID=UPI0022FF2050|nr:uncharacterized protein J7T55_014852 [Diaporthe amygdali]KAJ0110049.1 hypothetical protein J7T55_014852 [Diaporthe amygdali]